MKDIVGNEINPGDVCTVTEQRSSSLNIIAIVAVRPGSIKGRRIEWDSKWEEGKRSSNGVVKLSDQQKAELLKNNPDYKKNYLSVLSIHNIKLS